MQGATDMECYSMVINGIPTNPAQAAPSGELARLRHLAYFASGFEDFLPSNSEGY